MTLTLAQLRSIMPRCKEARALLLLPFLNESLLEWGIQTPARAAAFLAQLAHESGELRYFEELASGEAYEGRRDLGNLQPGDGKRFKGRGPIQLTGRLNYRLAGAALQLPLEAHPETVALPDVGFRVAGWFWATHGCNALADAADFLAITKRINGGTNGLAARAQYWARAKAVLGVQENA